MPGSNEYSKAPENRTGASKISSGEGIPSETFYKPTPIQSRLDKDIRQYATKTFSKPASILSLLDKDLAHVLAKMPDELKLEMVIYGNKLINKPKWSFTNASIDTGATTYKVQAGNTLEQIVADYNKKNGTALKWQDVAKWSGISDPSKMRIGHMINFSDPAASKVDTITAPTDTFNGPLIDTAKLGALADSIKAAKLDTIRTPQVDSNGVSVADTILNAPIDSMKVATISPAVKQNRFNLAALLQSKSLMPSYTITIPTIPKITYNKQGGIMNKINYFQQGGAASQQDIKAQVIALVQAAMQGDQKATLQVNQIMEAAKAGDQQAVRIAQIMEQVIKEMQGQAVAAKYGAKLAYLQSLKCGGKAKAKKKEKGGRVCPECEKGMQIEMKACGGKSPMKVEEKACGGKAKKAKKAKKHYLGGSVDKFEDGDEAKQLNKKKFKIF